MKKKLLVIFMSLGLSGAFAEESGLFVGFGGSFQTASKSVVSKVYNVDTTTNTVTFTSSNKDLSQNNSNYGGSFLIGYKYMFEELSGVRIYLNYDYNAIKLKKENSAEAQNSNYQILGLNLDYLYNFVDGFGFFLGTNFGAMNWDKNLHGEINQYNMYFAPQLGLRTSFAQHSLELFAKFPLISTDTITKSNPEQITVNNQKVTAWKNTKEVELKPNYNIGLRYIFTF